MAEQAEAQHAQKITGLFGKIAPVYDVLNRIFSFGLDAFWRKTLVEKLAAQASMPDPVFLDLAAGTLEVTVGICKRYPHATVLAADFCEPMLRQGKAKLFGVTKPPQLLVSDARFLALPDESVHAVTIAFGLRNMQPREAALREALRVLRPGGQLFILDFGSARDKIMFGIYNLYLAHVLPFIGRCVSRDKGAYQHLADSIKEYPSAEELREELQALGFAHTGFEKYTAGIICLHSATKKAYDYI